MRTVVVGEIDVFAVRSAATHQHRPSSFLVIPIPVQSVPIWGATFANYALFRTHAQTAPERPTESSLVARWWQIDVSVMRNGLTGSILLVGLALGLVLVRRWRQRLYLPLSVLVAVMCVCGPYSAITHVARQANALLRRQPALHQSTCPPPHPRRHQRPAEVNPVVSPLQQQAQVSYSQSTTSATRTRSGQAALRAREWHNGDRSRS
jgi:hypothetical protein